MWSGYEKTYSCQKVARVGVWMDSEISHAGKIWIFTDEFQMLPVTRIQQVLSFHLMQQNANSTHHILRQECLLPGWDPHGLWHYLLLYLPPDAKHSDVISINVHPRFISFPESEYQASTRYDEEVNLHTPFRLILRVFITLFQKNYICVMAICFVYRERCPTAM
jgi:hypothetical protein